MSEDEGTAPHASADAPRDGRVGEISGCYDALCLRSTIGVEGVREEQTMLVDRGGQASRAAGRECSRTSAWRLPR